MEPDQFRRGKLFHEKVQTHWQGFIEGKPVRKEYSLLLKTEPTTSVKSRRGRIDIFVDKISDFVTIMEIKSTDWDKIKSQNVKRLLQAHTRQLFKYIDKYLEVDKCNVCAVIIYPKVPTIAELRSTIENYYNDNGFYILWHENELPNVPNT